MIQYDHSPTKSDTVGRLQRMIKLQDFAVECGVTDRQVQRLLKKYEEDLTGHFERKGANGTWLDEEACQILRGRMKQQPIVVGDAETQREVERLKEEVLRLHEKLESTQDALRASLQAQIELQGTQALLEASERRTEALEADLEAAKNDLDKFEPFAFGLWRLKK